MRRTPRFARSLLRTFRRTPRFAAPLLRTFSANAASDDLPDRARCIIVGGTGLYFAAQFCWRRGEGDSRVKRWSPPLEVGLRDLPLFAIRGEVRGGPPGVEPAGALLSFPLF